MWLASLKRRCTARKAHRQTPARRVLANSFPKSGTHLLERLLRLLFEVAPSAEFLRTDSHKEAERVLTAAGANCSGRQSVLLRGHQRYEPQIAALLARQQFRTILILRDPRDVVVSHARWVVGPKHGNPKQRAYYASLAGFQERLLASIVGRPASATPDADDRQRRRMAYHGHHLHIGDRLRRYLPWLDDAGTCVVRFENLIGPAGGGSVEAQRREICRVAAHLQTTLSEQAVEALAGRLFSPAAFTFRKGQIGGWRSAFTEAHTNAFKRAAGDLLIELGYEESTAW